MPAAKSKTPRQTKLNFGNAKTKPNTPDSKHNRPANGNILNFFKKVEVEEALFIEGQSETPKAIEPEEEDDIYRTEDDVKSSRYNEDGGYSKKRKLNHDEVDRIAQSVVDVAPCLAAEDPRKPAVATEKKKRAKGKGKGKGPFLDDSDSEYEAENGAPTNGTAQEDSSGTTTIKPEPPTQPIQNTQEKGPALADVPASKQEESVYEDFKNLEEMEDIFDDEDFGEDGEEFREMRYMQEQAKLEAEETGNYGSEDLVEETSMNHGMTENCPLCDVSLAGITPNEATVHVNACLDGKPLPLPTPATAVPKPVSAHEPFEAPEMGKRFAKADVPRPGQANPINFGSAEPKATSAFSKLMSGHAEDAAWASAAAAETASRGKPAYQRTCPFYKIMPGFFICVDAFRYGAVKGCNAYFLSHFHSDHYVGLTANWSHGPIYCSKVTGSLVKHQLRTNAKWVVELEFEEKIEVPGTESVFVTMLSANHCPGSSLFLFEKTMGTGLNSRTQRILHCGDFRACPAQVKHPILRPDIVDSVSGKIKQQKIDVCYLDTTYLNPRYSFPPQDDVINACAEFCRTISGDPNATDDAFEALKREKGTTSLGNYFTKESAGSNSNKTDKKEDEANPKNRLLVICGTYSIGKERICKAIAQALGTKIFASASKIRIIKQLDDPELCALLTTNPHEAQVHMQMLMEIRAETLQEYLNGYKPHFSRIIGFRPSGWSFRNPNSTAKSVPTNISPSTIATTQLLHGPLWKTKFGAMDFVAQRGSTKEAMCFGVPYSEHSSFRELALFVMTLRIEKVVPTVNVGSEQSRKRMKGWLDRWIAERRRGGIVQVLEDDADAEDEGEKSAKSKKENSLWEGKDSRGGVRW